MNKISIEEDNFGGFPDSSDKESLGVSTNLISCNSHSDIRTVNAIRAGKSVGRVELDSVENFFFPDVFSNSTVNVVPVSSSISNLLSSVSLKRSRIESEEKDNGHVGKRAKEMDSEEKCLGTGGLKCRISVVISWFNRDNIFCSKEINALLDTGAEITILNSRLVVDQLMPWRHRIKSLRMLDASGNRLKKSGKIVVTSVDLKVQDASTKRNRTFKPTFEVADLGESEDMIIGHDWIQQTTEKIVMGPPVGLEFKSEISEIESNTEEFSNIINEAAYVGIITISSVNEHGIRIMTISIEEENKILMENVPIFYTEFHKVFGKEMQTELPEHGPQDIAINLLPNSELPAAKLYPMSQDELQVLKEYIEEMMKHGKIQEGSGSAGSPVFFVKEKTGKLRLVVDYRGLNAITIKDAYPIPLMTTLMEQIQGSNYFNKLDLKNGFNLIRVKEGDEWKTAFKTRYGLFEYKVMPFGLTNAPSVFQRYVNHVLREHIDRGVVVYIDDILIYAKTEEELIKLTKSVLKKLEDNKLCINAKKCLFHQSEVEFVGFIIGKDGVKMSEKKVKNIIEWKEPKSLYEIQQFLGFANFYRRFIRGYSSVVRLLSNLTRKGQPWNWNQECQQAFDELKSRFISAPILVNNDSTRPKIIETDASNLAKGAVLSQLEPDNRYHPIAFYSKKFSDAELNYDIHDKEMVVIVEGFKEWSHFL